MKSICGDCSHSPHLVRTRNKQRTVCTSSWHETLHSVMYVNVSEGLDRSCEHLLTYPYSNAEYSSRKEVSREFKELIGNFGIRCRDT